MCLNMSWYLEQIQLEMYVLAQNHNQVLMINQKHVPKLKDILGLSNMSYHELVAT